jgi:hypothetical protein
MANQRHKDKKPLGLYMFEWDKEHLREKSAQHRTAMSDIVKAALLNFDTLSELEQKSWVNKIELEK